MFYVTVKIFLLEKRDDNDIFQDFKMEVSRMRTLFLAENIYRIKNLELL